MDYNLVEKENIRLGKVSKIKKIKLVEFSTKGGGGVRMGRFSTKKKKNKKKKCKDDQNGLIHPEN